MEGCDHLQELWRTPNSFQKGKETVSAHQVEGLGQVDEGKVKWASLFAALLLKLSEGEYHVDCRSLCTEPALRLWRIAHVVLCFCVILFFLDFGLMWKRLSDFKGLTSFLNAKKIFLLEI